MPIAALIGTIKDPLTGRLAGGVSSATLLLGAFIRLLTIGAGLYAFLNFVVAGIGFISSGGNPQGIQQAWAKIYQSLIGLSVVILSFVFAGLLGLIFFGSATAILIPKITGP